MSIKNYTFFGNFKLDSIEHKSVTLHRKLESCDMMYEIACFYSHQEIVYKSPNVIQVTVSSETFSLVGENQMVAA